MIVAIGQETDLSFIGKESRISVEKGRIVVDEESLETGRKDVFAGGDTSSGPGSVIHAIAAGRKAASSIDRALGGAGDIGEVLLERKNPSHYLGREEGFARRQREKVSETELSERHGSFQEVALGYKGDRAPREAGRCLQCDLRLALCSNPSPPKRILMFSRDKIDEIPEEEGVYQLYDEDRNIIAIKGTANLRQSLLSVREDNEIAAFFRIEKYKMFSQREMELIQQYLQEHGEMPGGGDDELDDLF